MQNLPLPCPSLMQPSIFLTALSLPHTLLWSTIIIFLLFNTAILTMTSTDLKHVRVCFCTFNSNPLLELMYVQVKVHKHTVWFLDNE